MVLLAKRVPSLAAAVETRVVVPAGMVTVLVAMEVIALPVFVAEAV